MEQAIQEQPYQQIKINCQELTHGDQLVEFILLKQKTEHKTRLLCRKCIEGPYSCYSQEVCLISDLFKDQFSTLQFTAYQNNAKQQFVDFLQKIEFQINFQSLKFKLNEIRARITYELDQIEESLQKSEEQYQKQLFKCQSLYERFKQGFDSTLVTDLLQEFNGKKLSPKDRQEIKKQLDQFASKFHVTSEKESEFKGLFTKLEEAKRDFLNSVNGLRVFREKFDLGENAIVNEIKQIGKVFSNFKFIQTELGNQYSEEILEKIHPNLKDCNNIFNQIKRIYSNNYDGLEYQKIYETLNANIKSPLLIILKTHSLQTIGAYINNQNSFLYQQNKRQLYLLKANQPSFILNNQVNKDNYLFSIGKDDLIVNSNFDNCSSGLGGSYTIPSEYEVGNPTLHLANQKFFTIIAIEIFKIELI